MSKTKPNNEWSMDWSGLSPVRLAGLAETALHQLVHWAEVEEQLNKIRVPADASVVRASLLERCHQAHMTALKLYGAVKRAEDS